MVSWPRTSSRSWIVLFVVLLVTIDVAFFEAYSQANSKLGFSAQVIGYVESTAFSVITVAIMIPVLLAVLDYFFKIRGGAEQRIEKDKQTFKEQRFDAIKETTKLWSDVFSLTQKVIYTKKRGTDHELVLLKQELETLDIHGNEIVSLWAARFKNLDYEDIDRFSFFFNVLLNSTNAVIQSLIGLRKQEAAGHPSPEDLQGSLGLILDGVKSILHLNLIRTLDLKADILDGDVPSKDLRNMNKEIDNRRELLKAMQKNLTQEEVLRNKLIPLANTGEAEDFRAVATNFRNWKKSHPNEGSDKFEDWQKMTNTFFKIPFHDFIQGMQTDYSPKYLEDLARYLSVCGIEWKIAEMALILEPPSKVTPVRAKHFRDYLKRITKRASGKPNP